MFEIAGLLYLACGMVTLGYFLAEAEDCPQVAVPVALSTSGQEQSGAAGLWLQLEDCSDLPVACCALNDGEEWAPPTQSMIELHFVAAAETLMTESEGEWEVTSEVSLSAGAVESVSA